jgi:hypothetical protein
MSAIAMTIRMAVSIPSSEIPAPYVIGIAMPWNSTRTSSTSQASASSEATAPGILA